MKKVTCIIALTLAILTTMMAMRGNSPSNNITSMTDQELKDTIAKYAELEQPQSAEPFIKEARKRAKSQQDTKWMLQIIEQDIALNQQRLLRETTSDDLLAKELNEAWTPLKQLLYLDLAIAQDNFYGLDRFDTYYSEDEDEDDKSEKDEALENIFNALSEPEILCTLKASDYVDIKHFSPNVDLDLNLLDYIGLTLASEFESFELENWDCEMAQPLEQFAQSTDEIPTYLKIVRILAKQAVRTNNVQSKIIAQALRIRPHTDNYIEVEEETDNKQIDDEFDYMPRHQSVQHKESPTLTALCNELEQMDVDENMPIASALKTYVEAERLLSLSYSNELSVEQANKQIDKAIEAYAKIIKTLPDTRFASFALRQINFIEKRELNLFTEDFILPNSPIPLRLNYRNEDEATIKIYAIGKNVMTKENITNAKGNIDKFLAGLKCVQTRHIALPKTQRKTINSIIYAEMKGLPAGQYILVANEDKYSTPLYNKEFSGPKRSYVTFTCTQLSADKIQTNRQLNYIVSDAKTGRPVDKAKVGDTGTTNNEGWLIFNKEVKGTHTQTISKGDDYFFFDSYGFVPHKKDDLESSSLSASIVTDRNIYKPGQKIFYKAFVFNRYRTKVEAAKEGTKYVIKLTANNGDKLYERTQEVGKFGSLNGEINIPEEVMKGSAILIIKEQNETDWRSIARTYLKIEDFKRTDNSISFDRITEVFRPGSDASVSGKCTAASGLPVVNANVEYEVEKIEFEPWPRSYRRVGNTKGNNGIATGNVQTDGDGHFKINFATDSTLEVCDYNITVRITDNRGETTERTTSVKVTDEGVRMNASTDKETYLIDNRPVITLNSVNDNGEPYKNMVHLTITPYKTRKPLRPRTSVMGNDQKPDTCLDKECYVPADEWDFQLDSTPIVDEEVEVCGSRNITLNNLVLKPKRYKITATTKALNGKEIRQSTDFLMIAYNGKSEDLPPIELFAPQTAQVSTDMTIHVGSGLPDAWVSVVLSHAGKIVKRETVETSGNIRTVKWHVPESISNGETLKIHAFTHRDNRRYAEEVNVVLQKPEPLVNMELVTKRDISTPGAKESWKLKVHADEETEVTASMYDQRLDKYTNNDWSVNFDRLMTYNNVSLTVIDPKCVQIDNCNMMGGHFYIDDSRFHKIGISDLLEQLKHSSSHNKLHYSPRGRFCGGMHLMKSMAVEDAEDNGVMLECSALPAYGMAKMSGSAMNDEVEDEEDEEKDDNDPNDTLPRTDFSETVFFAPSLLPDSTGNATVEFTLPDNLTAYNFRAIAHDRQMRKAEVRSTLTVRKAINVRMGTPRFVTEGDVITLSTDVTITDPSIENALLTIKATDPTTGTELLTTDGHELNFGSTPSAHVDWRVTIPEGVETIRLTATAKAQNNNILHTDAEQVDIHVAKLYNEIAESHTYMLYHKGTSEIPNPFAEAEGKTQSLTFNYTSNTFIEVLRALPSLNEGWSESADTYSGRFETAAIAMFLKQKPEICQAIEYLRDHADELSTIGDDKERKELTPWLYVANAMKKHNTNLVTLFNGNTAEKSAAQALNKLAQMQKSNGGIPWFADMESSIFMTTAVVNTFGELMRLGVVAEPNAQMKRIVDRATPYLSKELEKAWADFNIMKAKREKEAIEKGLDPSKVKTFLSWSDLELLRACVVCTPSRTKVMNEMLDHLAQNWQTYSNNQRVLSAWLLLNVGKRAEAETIVESLEQNLIHLDNDMAYVAERSMIRLRIQMEAQAMMIMTLSRIRPQSANLPKLINYLVAQKRGEAWPDAHSTSTAVLSLLGSQAKLAAHDVVRVGERTYEATVSKPKLSIVLTTNGSVRSATVKKENDMPSWGSWQRVLLTPTTQMKADGTEDMTVSRTMEVRRIVNGKEKWQPLEKEALTIGDQIRVTLKFYNKMPMSFVRLSDHRAATLEPQDKLSGYRGWWFWRWIDADIETPPHYMEIGNESVRFYIDHLYEGWHQISYILDVTHAGTFAAGYADEVCMYDTEFKSHTEGCSIEVVGRR